MRRSALHSRCGEFRGGLLVELLSELRYFILSQSTVLIRCFHAIHYRLLQFADCNLHQFDQLLLRMIHGIELRRLTELRSQPRAKHADQGNIKCRCNVHGIFDQGNRYVFWEVSFVNKNKDAIIYLSACSSGKDDRLAIAFLKRGFDCVFANSDVTYAHYSMQKSQGIFQQMCKDVTPVLDARTALTNAQYLYGERDTYSDSEVTIYSDAMVALPVGQLPQVVKTPAVAAATPAAGSGDDAAETGGVATDRGRDDPDYSGYEYFSEVRSSSGTIDIPWISPIPEDTGIISC